MNKSLIEKIYPVSLLTIYNDNYIDFRKVNNKGQVSSSKPFYVETARKIFKHLNFRVKIKKFSGIIPNNLLYCDPVNNIYCWYNKPCKRKLFHTDENFTGEYALPGIIFTVKGNSLYVRAVKGFRPKSRTYRAPFTNIMLRNGMCMGSAQLKIENLDFIEDVIDHAEHKFFISKFSHNPKPYELLGFKKDKFPNNELVELPKTIEEYVSELQRASLSR